MRLARRTATIATILALGAIAAPGAQAGGLLSDTRPDPPGAAQQEAQSFLRIYSHQASRLSAATPDQAAVAREQASESAAFERIARIDGRNIASSTGSVATVTSQPLGFQYGDAAIGAGVMAGLVLLAIGGAFAIRHRRQLR
jgi:hypothetical protein